MQQQKQQQQFIDLQISSTCFGQFYAHSQERKIVNYGMWCNAPRLKLCVYLSDTTIRWKMYEYLLHKINYMFRPYFHWPSSG